MKRLDLTGRTFGHLIVLAREASRGKSSFWLCQCACGTLTSVRGGNLLSGRTESCGCRIPRNQLQIGEAARNFVYRKFENAARRHGLIWELSLPVFTELAHSNCALCDAPPQKITTVKGCKGGFTGNGITIRDRGRGYVPGNAIPACYFCLSLLGRHSVQKFLDQVSKIATRAPRRGVKVL